MYGYTGKILRVDLTNRRISTIETKDYEQFGGGGGIGTAIFWDLVKDKTISGFDPRNVVTVMASPLSGTPTFSGSSRTEVNGIGVESYPVGWYTRANFGGRFAAMLKYAGWDGIVIEGKADKPVYLDIRDRLDSNRMGVEIKDATWLWGMDTWETQQQIWREVGNGRDYGDWNQMDKTESAGRTTQRPAVMAIGPAGETLCRFACLVHDAGNAAGQGGFGAVLGSKNLKAVSVIGTGSVSVADPKALMDVRMQDSMCANARQKTVYLNQFWRTQRDLRAQGCIGCNQTCRARYPIYGNESQCVETVFSFMFDRKGGEERYDSMYMSADLAQKIGINVYPMWRGTEYLRALYEKGILGKGKQIDSGDLPIDKSKDVDFVEKLMLMIVKRQGIGNDLAEGFPRAAEKWGRVQEDFKSGILFFPYWGYADHAYDPRTELEWGYGSILAERDCNEHCFNGLFWTPSTFLNAGKEPPLTAEKMVQAYVSKMYPVEGDMQMLDFSTENAYSEHMAKTVVWQRDYCNFYKHSLLLCDQRYPRWFAPDGMKSETMFYTAVTGKKLDFLEGMAIGRKVWNMKNAIWSAQGRHRDMVHFAQYIYEVPFPGVGFPIAGWHCFMPGIKDGKWQYLDLNGRSLDKAKFEDFKTIFYNMEGWDAASGWPKRSTLEAQGLKYVADELEKNGKLGKG